MNPIRFATFSLSLLAAACGGADFQAGEPGAGDGATGDAELDGSGTGGSPSDSAPSGTGGADADASPGGAGGANNASGGAPASGGTGARPGSGGALATGGASPGGTTAAGGAPGTGGAPESGGAAGTGGAPTNGDCPAFACPVSCAQDLGTCCLGPRFSPTGCGCLVATGMPSTPFACHQE